MRSCVAPQTADIWLQVAADHLSREDCVALSSTCRFMRNLLLPSAFSLLSIYSPRGLNHVLTRKQRKKMLTANESENSPFLAAFRRIYVGCILTRTQDDVIRFNLPLMANLSVFRGRYRANNHAMRVYAILRMMPTLKELSLYWKVTCTNTNSRDIAFEHPPMCALTMISTSGAILDDLLNRTDSPCIKSFEELWIRYPLEMNEAIAQLTRLGPFPSFQRVKVVSALGMRPQSLWDLFAAHLFITSVVIHRALSAPLTEAECIRLPQNLRVLSIDNEAITRLVYVALEKHRGADGGFAVTGALETALSQCSQLEELILIGKINTSAPFIALFKSLILTSHISLKKLSLIFHRSPPLVDLLDILVPFLHEPLARGCETVSVSVAAYTTSLPKSSTWSTESVSEDFASKLLFSLEEIGRTMQERTIGVRWTRLIIQTTAMIPVEFRRELDSNEWTLPSETYDSSVRSVIEAKYGPSGIRFSTKDGTSTVIPRIYAGQWGRNTLRPIKM